MFLISDWWMCLPMIQFASDKHKNISILAQVLYHCILLECKHLGVRDQVADSSPSSSSAPLTWSCPSGWTADVGWTSHVHLCSLPEKPASAVCPAQLTQFSRQSWHSLYKKKILAGSLLILALFLLRRFLLSSFFMGRVLGSFTSTAVTPPLSPSSSPPTACRYL